MCLLQAYPQGRVSTPCPAMLCLVRRLLFLTLSFLVLHPHPIFPGVASSPHLYIELRRFYKRLPPENSPQAGCKAGQHRPQSGVSSPQGLPTRCIHSRSGSLSIPVSPIAKHAILFFVCTKFHSFLVFIY